MAIEYRWAEGHYDRLPALAADLVRRQVTVIAATTTPGALAAKEATATIPIIFTIGADPIAIGLVVSLSRPSGNVTGVNNYLSDIGAKRLELLRELVPNAAVIAMLVNPNFPDAESQSKDVKEAARMFGQQVHVVNASSESDFNRAFTTLVELQAGALLVTVAIVLRASVVRRFIVSSLDAQKATYAASMSSVPIRTPMLIMSAGTGSIRVSHMAPLPRVLQHPSLVRTLPSSVRLKLGLHHGCCNAATNGDDERDRNKGNPHSTPPFAGVDDWNPYPNAEVRRLVPAVRAGV